MKRAPPLAAGALLALLTSRGARAEDAAPTEPLVTFGARAGPQWIYLEGDGAPSDLRGYVAGADVTLALTRHIGVAGLLEGSLYDGRGDRLEPGPPATSLGAFGELRLDTHPEGPWSMLIGLGTGYRWLTLPLASGPADGYGGVEPLRLRLGPAYRVARSVDVTVAFGLGFGWFTARPGARDCAVTGACQDSLLDSDTSSATHFVADLTVGVRAWP